MNNSGKGILKSPAKLYVCSIKVTNQGATYELEDEYKNPYIFRADNIFLCYLSDKMSRKEQIKYKNVEYYSLRKDGDHEWATYELKPGESITYNVGFILGDNLDGKELDMKKGKLYLSNTGGSEDGEYYNRISEKAYNAVKDYTWEKLYSSKIVKLFDELLRK